MIRKRKFVLPKIQNISIYHIQNKYLESVFKLNALQDFFSSVEFLQYKSF